ncbi:synembryn-A-like isoform X2 [Mya arenaria]|uniref:synembryn-A-like isoform X2 n=1 Tax=Mya arenaria TaxID=6604 RepID=UPI0022E5D17A|nr:synembryn-A-like isoform X2 [Mya arenaria]
MDASTINLLRNGSESEVEEILRKFNEQNAKTFTFSDLSDDLKEKIAESLLKHMTQKLSPRAQCLCLQTIRLFSREKTRLGSLVSDDTLAVLMRLAGLEHYSRQGEEESGITIQLGDSEVTIEAQKCLCNLIFNSAQAQAACSKNGCVEGIVQRLKTYKDPDLQFDIKFFDMRLLFLLTALCADTRPKIRFELHGFTYMIEVIDLIVREAESRSEGLTDQEVDLCSEILKILFNLTVTVDRNNLDEEEDAHMMRLVCVLRDLLLCTTASKDKREGILSHTVNLLINMPRDCYEELLAPMSEGEMGGFENKEVEYDGKNMEAIVILLNFLHDRMDRPTKSLKESLTPILHCLCETCRANRSIRKFCRAKVLPPLKDEVKHLPEEGNTLRNRLCKLLTSPILEVKELAADFLFVLCKESVQRMVKYTGYGNCAGLLANRGLLLGGQGQGDYSSDSEDSDTEDYSNLAENTPCFRVNPVTGRFEEDKAKPWEGMTDEQKEYEAMKLVNAMDKLNRAGIIQPSTLGEDGRPVPVSHILELMENQPNIPANQSDEEDE